MINRIYNKFRRITTNQLYFPEIDGIRFVAIALVVIFHAAGYFIDKTGVKFADDPHGYTLLNTFIDNGNRGVQLFFVLSGFILCLPFAHHYINNGKRVSLKKYYLRRVTRLEPPYFIAMTGLLMMHIAMKTLPVPVLVKSWLASLIYSHGFIYHHTPLLTVVAWSLEVEIQFYILAPLLFRLLSLHKFIRRTVLLVACIGMVCVQHIYPPTFTSIYQYLQFFLTGILLADFFVSDTAPVLFNKKWMWLICLAAFITLMYIPINTNFLSQLSLPLLLGLFCYIVLKNDIVKSVFSYKFIPIIGGMCYSIYLLHFAIISAFGRLTIRLHITDYYLPNLILQIALLSVPILVLSSVFYYYIERPFMSSKWLNMLLKKDKKQEEINPIAEEVTAQQ